jgi:DNA modification methylase
VRGVSVRLIHGECVEAMRALEENSVDAVVADPPYGIGFMGHEWDQPGEFGALRANGEPGALGSGDLPEGVPASQRGVHRQRSAPSNGGAMHAGRYDLSRSANLRFQAWCESWAREALRLLKPGGYLLAFGGGRTYHRLACGVEDAGFEIRDRILDLSDRVAVECPGGELAWVFGSGYPKGRDVGKAIDVEGRAPGDFRRREAAAWQGHHTGLKPAHEPIVVARAPLAGTVAETALEWGTGALSIDPCRIPVADVGAYAHNSSGDRGFDGTREEARATGIRVGGGSASSEGRWPANLIVGEISAAILDAQSGRRRAGGSLNGSEPSAKTADIYGAFAGRRQFDGYGDSGGASRFFYCPKVSRAERDAGLEGFAERELSWSAGESSPGTFQSPGTERAVRNYHPTVKPIELMRWLIRLVTRPGAVVLDPFAGSGTTACAAALEGRDFIGIEREPREADGPDYFAIAAARVAFWSRFEGAPSAESVLASAAAEQRGARRGQLRLEGGEAPPGAKTND